MYVIGELINGMFSKVGSALQKRDAAFIQDLAKRQCAAGAQALDVNCGPSSSNPAEDMRWLVETIQDVVSVPLSLDSTKEAVIEAGLMVARQPAIINSTSADPQRLARYLEMASRYEASVIVLTMDQRGVPQDKDRRVELAAFILETAQNRKFPLDRIYLDPIVYPVAVAQNQGAGILEAIRDFKILTSPAAKTIIGLSNISQGSEHRRLLNRTFLIMAQSAGLDAAILDPLDELLMEEIIAGEVLLNKFVFCSSFLQSYRQPSVKSCE